jgi:hypothetical protein
MIGRDFGYASKAGISRASKKFVERSYWQFRPGKPHGKHKGKTSPPVPLGP